MRGRARVLAVGIAALSVVAAPGSAVAHGKVVDVQLDCRIVEADAPLVQTCAVTVAYSDGDPVSDAAVRLTATREGTRQAALGPVSLAVVEPSSGVYSGAVEFPAYGRWQVAVAVGGGAEGTAVVPLEILPPTPGALEEAGASGASVRLVSKFGLADARNIAIRLSHVLAIAVWLGGVAGVGMAARDGHPSSRQLHLHRWARLFPWVAGAALAAITASGVLNALYNVPTRSPGLFRPGRVADLPFGTAYLVTFGVKLALGVALAWATIALARTLRRGWGVLSAPPGPGPGTPARAAERRVIRVVILNLGLAGLTVAVTVVLGQFHMISHVGGTVGS